MGGAATTKRLVLAVSLLCLTLVSAGQAKPYKTYIQKGDLRVAFWGHIAPRKLPRVGVAPVAVSISADIATIDNTSPPQLQTIKLEINRNGRLDPGGLPTCRYRKIQPASTAEARGACSSALVGDGSFRANVALPEQSPFPSNGRILAFNGSRHGRPVILAHIYGTKPLPTSFTLPFEIRRHRAGTYGLILTAHLPQVAADWGFVRGISLTLGRRFRYRGERRSYVSAGCPAPAGFPGSTFALARTAFGFANGEKLESVIVRNCYARGIDRVLATRQDASPRFRGERSAAPRLKENAGKSRRVELEPCAAEIREPLVTRWPASWPRFGSRERTGALPRRPANATRSSTASTSFRGWASGQSPT